MSIDSVRKTSIFDKKLSWTISTKQLVVKALYKSPSIKKLLKMFRILISTSLLCLLCAVDLSAHPIANQEESVSSVSIASSPSTALTSAYSSVITSVASVVTASDYSNFLNAVAVSDSHHLYDETMESDPATASIVRVGAPGRWKYHVIAGRENFPIHYVNRLQAEASFAGRLQVIGYRLQEEANDDYLSCNSEPFEVEVPSTMLTLVSSSFPTSTSTSNFDSYITDVSSAAALLGILAAPELMMRLGALSARGAAAAPLAELPLEHF
ncbi:MAG: hypothetical protein ACH346_06895, partial [Chthoniobacterales bacterium]